MTQPAHKIPMISVTTDRADGGGTLLKETGSDRKNSLPGAPIVSLPVKLLLASLRSSLTGRTEGGCSGQWRCGMSFGACARSGDILADTRQTCHMP